MFLLWRSWRGTLLTVDLASLGDGPKLALAAQEDLGPLAQAGNRLGKQIMTEILIRLYPIGLPLSIVH